MIDDIINFDLHSNKQVSIEEDVPKIKDDYKTKYYWALPENVRNAIDRAKEKQQ